MGFARRLLAFGRFMVLACWQSATTPADVILATSTPLTVVVPGIVGSWARRVPWVLEVRDLWPELPIAVGALKNPLAIRLARALELLGYRSATHIIALSPGMRAGVAETGVGPEKVTLIPNAADLDRFGPAVASAERFLSAHGDLRGRQIVMYAGTIGLINGIDYLAEIAAAARKDAPSTAFVVIGDGRYRTALIERATQLGVNGKNFFVLDPLPKDQIGDALASATVCVSLVIDLQALWANSANKFFDGLAAGKPMVINHEGWQADLIRDHDIGLVLPARDADRAWCQLQEFLSSPTQVEKAGCRARLLAESEFDRDKLAITFERVLMEAASIKH